MTTRRSGVESKRSRSFLGRPQRHSFTLHWSQSGKTGNEPSDKDSTQSAFSAIEALDVDISDSDLNIQEMRLKHHIFRIEDGAKGEFLRVLFKAADSAGFKCIIMLIVIFQAALLCWESWVSQKYLLGWYFEILDSLFLGVYIAEAVVKIAVWQKFYFLDPWNWLDFLVIILALVMMLLEKLLAGKQVTSEASSLGSVKVLRVVRVFRAMKALRILKALHFFRKLQVILKTIILSMKPLVSIIVLIVVIIYVFAVMARGMFPEVREFRSIFRAMFFLFGILTMDDWYIFYNNCFKREVKQVSENSVLIFLIVYFILNWLIMINLFVAVLVDNFTIALHKEEKDIGPIDEDDEDDLMWEDVDDEEVDVEEEKRVSFESYYPLKDPNYPPIYRTCLKEYFKSLVTISNCLYTLKSNNRLLDTMIEYTGQES